MLEPFSLDGIIAADDFITSDQFLDFCNREEGLTYWKRDFLFRSGVWRGSNQPSLISNVIRYRNTRLVIGHSDITTNFKDVLLLRSLGFSRIFGTNTRPIRGVSQSIPLGLTNNSNESPLHQVLGDTAHFLRAYEKQPHRPDFDPTLYINFTISNNLTQRTRLLSVLERFPYVNREQPDMSVAGRISYLANLRKYSFTACPEGNGPDTHRMWETLYMGGFPVVLRNSFTETLCQDLPILLLTDWEEILNLEIMKNAFFEFTARNQEYKKLSANYWNKTIYGLGNEN